MLSIFRRKTRLLLDECVTRRVIIKSESDNLQHSVTVLCLGWGAKDRVIREHAKITGKVVVTSDYNMICQCLDNGIQTAVYYKGRAYVVKLSGVQEIGIHAPSLGFVAP